MSSGFVVLDLETTTYKQDPKKANPSPFVPGNEVVLGGVYDPTSGAVAFFPRGVAIRPVDLPDVHCIIGHNLAFDLHYLMRDQPEMQEHLGKKLRIWDTQLAEFILSGQTKPYAKLDDISVERGGTKKPSMVPDLWAAFVDTDTIASDHPKELLNYLEGDLKNTWIVAVSQMEEAARRGMMPLILSQMEALQATIDMTFNGMKIDVARLAELELQWGLEADKLRVKLENFATTFAGWPGVFNPGSGQQLATLLYGGEVEYPGKEQIGVYKGGPRRGKPRYQNVTLKRSIGGLGYKPIRETEGGQRAVDELTLRQLLPQVTLPTSRDFVHTVLEYRAVKKQLTTYAVGLRECTGLDGFIHHGINHCVARTGRLTSSKPNLQNVTNGDIKSAFISRFEEGKLVEADFKQLEMIALAFLSKDTQLMDDICMGRDMHTELYIDLFGRAPTKEQRKEVKPISFALVYGAGANKIADQSGLSVEFVRKFIGVFYTRYKGVARYHNEIVDFITVNGVHKGKKDTDGIPIKEFVLVSQTGRHYPFEQYTAPDFILARDPKAKTFSPTEIKNRPVQGLATADIVPLAVGRLYRRIYGGNLQQYCRLINTVHDSIMADVAPTHVLTIARIMREVLTATPAAIEQTWGFKFPLPLDVNVSQGPTWLDQQEIAFPGTSSPAFTEKEEKCLEFLES
jgi:DNA polymerase I-like protein with 3'-5' exonuclease and polymerase domains